MRLRAQKTNACVSQLVLLVLLPPSSMSVPGWLRGLARRRAPRTPSARACAPRPRTAPPARTSRPRGRAAYRVRESCRRLPVLCAVVWGVQCAVCTVVQSVLRFEQRLWTGGCLALCAVLRSGGSASAASCTARRQSPSTSRHSATELNDACLTEGI